MRTFAFLSVLVTARLSVYFLVLINDDEAIKATQGLERWLNSKDQSLLLQRTWVCFSAPTWCLVIVHDAVLKDPTPSSDLHRHQAHM